MCYTYYIISIQEVPTMNVPKQPYEITGRTRLICLLGNPVSHSKSPMMHNEGFRQLGLDYCYLAF